MPTDDQIASALAALRALTSEQQEARARERREAVTSWSRGAHEVRSHGPEPWVSERQGADGTPEPLADDDLAGPSLLVGRDADGRLAAVDEWWSGERGPEETWTHGDGFSERLARHELARILLDADGRALATVALLHERPVVERWSWEGDRPSRVDGAWLSDERVMLMACRAERDDDGRLARLLSAVAHVDRPAADEVAALQASLDLAAALTPSEVVFDARLHRREPRLRGSDALVAVLAPALEQAVVTAVARSGIEQPFAVEVRHRRDHALPLVRVGSAAFRDRVRTTVPDRHAALTLLAGAQPPDGAEVELLDLLDVEPLRALRELDWALGNVLPRGHGLDRRPRDLGVDETYRDGAGGRAADALDALGEELARRLNARDWPGAADPFLALVHLTAPTRPVRPFVRAAAAIGKQRVQAFRASIAPAPPAPPAEAPAAALHDRAALARFLADSGLAADAERLAHEVARLGLRLEHPGGVMVRSRLGGPGLLAPGRAWPHAEGDRPHTFLAGIDLSELPPTGVLPEAGWLLFFADVDDEDGEAAGLIDVSDNAPGAQIEVTYLEPGVEPVAAAPPSRLRVVLAERRVRAVPQLTLPISHEAADALGLGPLELKAYERAIERSVAPEYGHHWVLGWATGAQGYMPDPDSELLLHLWHDDGLGFHYLDAGSLQFTIPQAALAARDWSRVVAHADSC